MSMVNFDSITRDPDIGKKLLIGSLLVLTGIGGLAVMGWMLEIIRRAKDRPGDNTLPDFDQIGPYFIDGLKTTALALLWSLPLIILVTLTSVLAIFLPSWSDDPEMITLMVLAVNGIVFGGVFIYLIPMLALLIPALCILADTGSVREAAHPGRAWALLRANSRGFFLAMLLGYLISTVLGTLGIMLCIVGIYPATVVAYGIQGQLFGAAYREARQKLGSA